jgi:hypothetical protein
MDGEVDAMTNLYHRVALFFLPQHPAERMADKMGLQLGVMREMHEYNLCT